jgi:hypothetical protein
LRLTIDLVPAFSVVVHREGEPVESAYKTELVEEAEDFGELKAALEAEEKAAREAPRGDREASRREAEGPAAEAQPEGPPAEAEGEPK